jgi:hypothetical protein
MLDVFSSSFLVFAYLATAFFHLAVALGAPLTAYVQGEYQNGQSPFFRRVVSAGLFLAFIAIAGHYVAQLGLLNPILNAAGNAVVNWVLVGIATTQALIALMAQNPKQKRLWASPTVTMVLAAIIVAV